LKVRKNDAAQGYSVSVGRSSRAFAVPREVAGDVRIVPEPAEAESR
jgi:hypothetical protein